MEIESNPLDGLTKPWQKFFKKFEEIETIKVSDWKEIHVLAYICKKYEQKFQRKFAVTIKGAPSKSPDMYIVKRIIAMLNTTSYKNIRDYIDWVFENKIKKQPFHKVGFFLTPGFVNEYSASVYKKNNEWDRSTTVPDIYKNIAKELNINVNTYGDLAFMQMSIIRNNDTSSNYYTLLGNLELIGLDLEKLKGLK